MAAQLARYSSHAALPAEALMATSLLAKEAGNDAALRSLGTVMHFTQDREIFGEGDRAALFFKVVSGVVRTCKFLSNGRRQIDAFHVAGDLFGFEPGAEYSLSAEAVCDCTLIAFRRSLDPVGAREQAMSPQIFSHVMESITRTRDHALLLGRKSAMEKVAAFLLHFAENSIGGRKIALAMARQDIADYLGLTIETVSRTLSQLERDGTIELMSARQIEVRNLATLRGLNA